MRPPSLHFADVFSHLRVAVAQELDTDEVRALLDDLSNAGWRPWELRHRVGALPAQPSSGQDAEVITDLLRRLRAEPSPQVRFDPSGAQEVVTPAPLRARPDCAVCQGESDFFVRRDVHLCARCVDLLAAGAVVAERDTGT